MIQKFLLHPVSQKFSQTSEDIEGKSAGNPRHRGNQLGVQIQGRGRLQAAIGRRGELTKSIFVGIIGCALTTWVCVRLSNVQTASKFKLRKEAKT